MNNTPTISKKFLTQLCFEILGSIFVAAAIYNFAVQAKFPMTGFSGISIILFQMLNIPIGLSTIVLNIPVAILCYKLLGKKFFISSLRCMVISSIFIDYIAPLFPVYEGSRLLAALCTGVIGGIGYSMIYMQNSSTGGMDFIILAVLVLVSIVIFVGVGWVAPAAITLCFAVLTIRRDEMTVLEYIKYATKYFITDQQNYKWR